MKHLRKTFLLTILMSMMSTTAFAYDAEIDDIYYNFSGTEAAVTYGDKQYTGSVVIPSSVTYEEQTYNVTSIGDEAFWACRDLTSITIPNSVTSIGWHAFENCSGLTSIITPNSVTSIGGYAFQGCSSLTSVIIGNSVTSIEYYVFSGCTSLTSIKVESGNRKFDSRDDCNAIIETACNSLVVGCKSTVIPNSVTSIGYYAFSGCTSLTSITIPNSVTNIGRYAFQGCSGLTSVIIGNSVASIGEGAFSHCSVLASITIPTSVTSIGEGAFSHCSVLASITIPTSVTSIGKSVFGYCSSLTSIKVESGNRKYDSRDDCNAIIKKEKNILIAGCKNTTIPNNVASIGEGAFSGCSDLTSVTIPNSVTSIGYYAFSGCTGLTSITIPNSVTNIGRYAFQDCSGLTSVTLNSDAVVSKTSSSFYLAKIFGEQVTEYIIGDDVTSIGNYAFRYCKKLISVTISNSVASIGSNAFSRCIGLTSITIPNSVTSIGENAFNDCTGLTSIISHIKKPFYIKTNVFSDETYNNAMLYVPYGTMEKYKAESGWENFKIIISKGDANSDGLVNVTDIVATVNFIMEKPSESFNKEAADLNGDGKVNVTDIVMMVSIIMDGDNE